MLAADATGTRGTGGLRALAAEQGVRPRRRRRRPSSHRADRLGGAPGDHHAGRPGEAAYSTVAIMTLGWALLYVVFALLVMRWSRGRASGGGGAGGDHDHLRRRRGRRLVRTRQARGRIPALPEDLLGLLTIIVIPVQFLLLVVAMIAFNQQWSVEEERPIGGAPPAGGVPPGGDAGETVAGPLARSTRAVASPRRAGDHGPDRRRRRRRLVRLQAEPGRLT